jgi:2,4-dienoyl-CoA reductase-like NADH-dependent reductase (Old Yellow Enzyme family)
LTTDQIEQLVNDFANASGRAIQAGFEGVEIHGAHFYLISQFLSPLTNLRTDKYGGDAEKRATFALEVIRAVKKKIGPDRPVFFRFNALEKVEGGQILDDALAVCRLLVDEGVDALDVSLIAQSSWREVEGKKYLLGSSALPKTDPFGANIEFTKELKEATGLPVIAVGKLGDELVAADAVQKSQIDILAIGRQMIADPDSAGKILSGKGSEIIPCKECMNCFLTIGQGAPMGCTVNKKLPFSKNKVK